MNTTLIKNASIVNEGQIKQADIKIADNKIVQIDSSISANNNDHIVDCEDCFILPGMIDDQVHFREPGLTHKGTIASESYAAVAGGITSFMEMPNVKPSTTSIEALDQKYAIAAEHSYGNYSFYLGATEDNLDQIKQLDLQKHCGVKIFMGASTGDLLVEAPHVLEQIFRDSPVLIVTHCEDNRRIQQNLESLLQKNKSLSITDHPKIRDAQACFLSSSYAVDLAKKHNSQLHVLHITTEKELALFEPGPIEGKSITAEACVHHLWFSDQDYAHLGNFIKCNPAIKAESDRLALLNAVKTGQIDIIATDHAPHTLEEKMQAYDTAPAGLPLVQHALLSLLEHVERGILSLEQVVEKICHNPARRYAIHKRGFIREGYYADLVSIKRHLKTEVTHQNCLYRCEWTPFNGQAFSSTIMGTWVNGVQVFNNGIASKNSKPQGMQLLFDR